MKFNRKIKDAGNDIYICNLSHYFYGAKDEKDKSFLKFDNGKAVYETLANAQAFSDEASAKAAIDQWEASDAFKKVHYLVRENGGKLYDLNGDVIQRQSSKEELAAKAKKKEAKKEDWSRNPGKDKFFVLMFGKGKRDPNRNIFLHFSEDSNEIELTDLQNATFFGDGDEADYYLIKYNKGASFKKNVQLLRVNVNTNKITDSKVRDNIADPNFKYKNVRDRIGDYLMRFINDEMKLSTNLNNAAEYKANLTIDVNGTKISFKNAVYFTSEKQISQHQFAQIYKQINKPSTIELLLNTTRTDLPTQIVDYAYDNGAIKDFGDEVETALFNPSVKYKEGVSRNTHASYASWGKGDGITAKKDETKSRIANETSELDFKTFNEIYESAKQDIIDAIETDESFQNSLQLLKKRKLSSDKSYLEEKALEDYLREHGTSILKYFPTLWDKNQPLTVEEAKRLMGVWQGEVTGINPNNITLSYIRKAVNTWKKYIDDEAESKLTSYLSKNVSTNSVYTIVFYVVDGIDNANYPQRSEEETKALDLNFSSVKNIIRMNPKLFEKGDEDRIPNYLMDNDIKIDTNAWQNTTFDVFGHTPKSDKGLGALRKIRWYMKQGYNPYKTLLTILANKLTQFGFKNVTIDKTNGKVSGNNGNTPIQQETLTALVKEYKILKDSRENEPFIIEGTRNGNRVDFRVTLKSYSNNANGKVTMHSAAHAFTKYSLARANAMRNAVLGIAPEEASEEADVGDSATPRTQSTYQLVYFAPNGHLTVDAVKCTAEQIKLIIDKMKKKGCEDIEVKNLDLIKDSHCEDDVLDIEIIYRTDDGEFTTKCSASEKQSMIRKLKEKGYDIMEIKEIERSLQDSKLKDAAIESYEITYAYDEDDIGNPVYRREEVEGTEREIQQHLNDLEDMGYWDIKAEWLDSNEYESVGVRDADGNTFRGAPNTEIIWHGDHADPQILTDGKLFNYWEVEDALWDMYKEEGGNENDEEAFNNFCAENFESLVYDWTPDNADELEDVEVADSKCKDAAPTYRGVEGSMYLSHGEWSDPEIVYDDKSINYWDAEQYLWDDYKGQGGKGSDDSEDFEAYANANAKEALEYLCDFADDYEWSGDDAWQTGEAEEILNKFLPKDSVHDSDEDDVDFLLDDEQEAIDGYDKVLGRTTNDRFARTLKGIKKEEKEHIDRLKKEKANMQDAKVKDSAVRYKGYRIVKDSAKNYSVYLKDEYVDGGFVSVKEARIDIDKLED